MIDCEALPHLDAGDARSVLSNHIEIAEAYARCAARHKALADWVRKIE